MTDDHRTGNPTHGSSLFDFRPPPPSPCRICKVRESIGGLCTTCEELLDVEKGRDEIRARIAAAFESIPRRSRGMVFDVDSDPYFGRDLKLDQAVGNLTNVSGYTHRDAYKAASEVGRLPTFLVFQGDTGSGKTSLAAALLNREIRPAIGIDPRLLSRSPTAPYVRGDDQRLAPLNHAAGAFFCDAFTIAKSRLETPLGRGEAAVIRRAIDATVLLLDDVGVEPVRSSGVVEVLFERARAEKATIVTTKLSSDELEKKYWEHDGRGLARRLFEKGVAKVIPTG